MSSGLRSTSSSPSRKSMRPFSGKDSLELQRRNPSRVPASAGMHGGSLTSRDGFLLIVRHLSAAIVSREGGRGHWAAATGCRRREAKPGKAPGTRAARWVYTRPTEIRSRGMLAPRWDTRRLVAWLALAATIGGGAARSGGSRRGGAPLRLVVASRPQERGGPRLLGRSRGGPRAAPPGVPQRPAGARSASARRGCHALGAGQR